MKPILSLRILLAILQIGVALAIPALPAPPVAADQALTQAICDPDRQQASGAIYRICRPLIFWNGNLVVYAHGYVAPDQPLAIPEDQLRLSDGTYLPDAVTAMGYAFAVTSYSTNGLAVKPGLADLIDLVNIFRATYPTLNKVYLVGPSEGGLITTLAVEQYPQVFHGGLATCGPVGDFQAQINYLGDFRVVFDYFFPGLMPGTPISIPQSLKDNWNTHFSTVIQPAITDPANAISVTQLFSVTGAACDPLVANSIIATTRELLEYNVLASDDAAAKLGGQPFDNQNRLYTGASDDAQLNAGVQRFRADPAATTEIQVYYQTTGRPLVPLVTLHTTQDEVVPYWHEALYRTKVEVRGMTPRHDQRPPVERYGHCRFTRAEITSALTLLLNRVANPPPFYRYLPLTLR